ncbi:MAG: hypothetical protein ABSG82_09810 [Sedimentisphaerales bacterium]
MLNWHSQYKEKSTAAGRDWLQRHSLAFQVGLLIGSVHMLFILANVIDAVCHHEGRWHMFWILCGYIDFPSTLLLSQVILPVLPRWLTFPDPYLAASRGPMFTIFLLFHTIVGSAWYFALPILISKAAVKIASTTKAAVAVAAMIIIPIPAHWLQLLRFIGHDTKSTSIGLNCILPGLWMILFAWLFVTNVRRKVLLWLFCLVPPVFYYLVRDLYYSIMLARY